jgi:hypothetical protein
MILVLDFRPSRGTGTPIWYSASYFTGPERTADAADLTVKTIACYKKRKIEPVRNSRTYMTIHF